MKRSVKGPGAAAGRRDNPEAGFRMQLAARSSTPLPGNGRWTRRAMLVRMAQAAAGAAAAGCLPETLVSAADRPADQSVWDAHVHLTGVAGTVEQRVDGLLEFARRMGIQRLVVCMGTSFVADPSLAELRR